MFTFTFLFVLFYNFIRCYNLLSICLQDRLHFKMFLTPLIKHFHTINNIIMEAKRFIQYLISVTFPYGAV